MRNSTHGITRLVKASTYSVAGLKAAWHNEAAFRQEVLLALILAPLGCWLGETALERIALLGVLFIVLITELLNSAIEALSDRISREHHELAGRAKDLASAAVLLSLVMVVVTWGTVIATRL